MPNEKMMILNMLQEGKITADEAAKLLSTVDSGEKKSPPPRSPAPRTETSRDAPISNDGRSPAPKPSTSAPVVDFDELGRKFDAFARTLEPKIHKLTETVAEKTVNLADKISKTIAAEAAHVSKPSTSSSGSPASTPITGSEQHIELTVLPGYNELSLAGYNGEVIIKGYNGDKISARIRYKQRRKGASVELMKLGGKYYLNYEEDDFEFVSINAYVPEHMFKVINISGTNGNMDLSALTCDQLQISNTNGQTSLEALAANNIKAESGNGRLRLANVVAPTAVFEHFNGAVDAWEIDAAQLSLISFNGTLAMNISKFDNYSDYLWQVETSNAKLNLNLPTLPNVGYHVKAQASLGNVRMGLTGLEFSINDPGTVEARTAHFDHCAKKVRLALETSNATLSVN